MLLAIYGAGLKTTKRTALKLQSKMVFSPKLYLRKLGVPQESVLGSTLFLLFCNDLPDIVEDCDREIHMYAEDTTICVAASSPDMIAIVLNVILQKLYG